MKYAKLISIIGRIIAIILLFIVSSSIISFMINTKPVVETYEGERALPAVVVFDSRPVEVFRRTIGYGIADATVHADVPSRVSSTIESIPPTSRVGRQLQKGDLIVQLDSTDFKQQVVKAEQSIASMKATQINQSVERNAAEERARIAKYDHQLSIDEIRRVEVAHARGAANQREVDFARQKTLATETVSVNATEIANKYPSLEEQTVANIKSLEADLVLAQENLRRCAIVSPIDGVLQDLDVRVGEHVTSGTRVARVVNKDALEIPLRLPSFARPYIHVGDQVSLRSAGFGFRSWESQISRIAPEDETQTRTMVAYVDIDQLSQGSRHIPPGLFIKAEVVDTFNPLLNWVVPRRSIKEDRIMVVRNGSLKSIPIISDFSIVGTMEEFSLPDEDWVVLQSSLENGDKVVVEPSVNLRDGMKVRSLNASEAMLE